MSDEQKLVATSSQTVGPFFHFALTPLNQGQLVGLAPGERIELQITVTDGDGQAVSDAIVELWQASGPESAFGRMHTGEDGTCTFTTMRPERDAGATPPQAPHINVCLFARGLLRHLQTRIYFAGDAALRDDPVLARVPGERRATLLATPDAAHPGRWQFHVRLQGPEETVFFDA